MPHQILPHTADVRLLVENETVEGLFIEALQGMTEIMKPIEEINARPASRRISLKAADSTALLVDFLNEVLSMTEIKHETYTDIVWQHFSERRLTVKLIGRSVAGFAKNIKAATYHEADIRKNPKGNFETVIIFDI